MGRSNTVCMHASLQFGNESQLPRRPGIMKTNMLISLCSTGHWHR